MIISGHVNIRASHTVIRVSQLAPSRSGRAVPFYAKYIINMKHLMKRAVLFFHKIDANIVAMTTFVHSSLLQHRLCHFFVSRSHFDGVRALAFHPVEPVLLTASEDHTLKLWNLQKTVPSKKYVLQ